MIILDIQDIYAYETLLMVATKEENEEEIIAIARKTSNEFYDIIESMCRDPSNSDEFKELRELNIDILIKEIKKRLKDSHIEYTTTVKEIEL